MTESLPRHKEQAKTPTACLLLFSPMVLAPRFELAHTLKGHTRYVAAVAFSKDGQRLATGSWDGTVKLWDVTSGREIRTLAGHNMAVTSVAFSPDGRLVASGSDDTRLILWDVASGHAVHKFDGDPGYVIAAAFSPDGGLVAASTSHGRISLFDVVRGELVRTLEGHTMAVHSIAFTRDGRQLISGGRDQTIRIWDVASEKTLRNLESTDRFLVYSLAVSPDGLSLAAGNTAGGIKFRRLATGECGKTETSGNGQPCVFPIAYTPDGKWVVSGGRGIIALWNSDTGKVVARVQGPEGTPGIAVEAIAVSPDGRWLASGGGDDDNARLWQVRTP